MKGGYQTDIKRYSLALEIARRLWIYKRQYAKVLIMGGTGRGKSYTALVLAWRVALWLSWFKYKDYDHWQEFFDLQNNLVVADKEMMLEVKRKGLKKHSVFIFDEIQISHNSRQFREEANMELNEIFQFKRTKQCLIIGTIQEHIAQDRQARNLYDFFIDMDDLDAYEEGVNFCKVFRVRLRPRSPKSKSIHTPYPADHGTTWCMCAVPMPPPEISKLYEKLRAEADEKREQEKKESEEGNTDSDEKQSLLRDRFYDFLQDNTDLLEKRENGKYHAAKYIAEEFTNNTGEKIDLNYARSVINKARKEYTGHALAQA